MLTLPARTSHHARIQIRLRCREMGCPAGLASPRRMKVRNTVKTAPAISRRGMDIASYRRSDFLPFILNAHGGVIPAPPPGSGSTAVGIVCKLREGSALIALGNCLVSRGFFFESPLTSSPVCRAAGILPIPMPWVCADLPARPRNSVVGSARLKLPGPTRGNHPTQDVPSEHGPHFGEAHGPEAECFCPKSES